MDTTKHVIDLHIHSLNSDGTCRTQEILDLLAENGADIISFTDHDSVGCYFDLENEETKLYPNMMLIPGVELSCRYNGKLRDMLGYGIDFRAMSKFLNERYSLEERLNKQQHVLKSFKDICRRLDLKFDDSITVKDGKKAEGFVVMYNELNKYPQNIERFPFISNNTRFYWDYFSNPNSEFYVDETFDLPSFNEAIDMIHHAGGLAFLAHPYAYGILQKEVEDMVSSAVIAGADGIELKHSSNKEGDVDHIKSFANKYHLLMSGGSDFHGTTKPGLKLISGYGNMSVQYDELKGWINKVPHIYGE